MFGMPIMGKDFGMRDSIKGETAGDIAVDGKLYHWNLNLMGGICLYVDYINMIHFKGDLTEETVRYLLIGYKAGHDDGERVGRYSLQNDYRNLMGLQR